MQQATISLRRKIQKQPSQIIQQSSNSHTRPDYNNLSHSINKHNQQAIILINNKSYPQAISHLQQAEKLLQYAANSGKQINRSEIIVIFYNMACVYQKMWCLQDCLDYLEGVIINLQKWLQELSCQHHLEDEFDRNIFCRYLNLKLLLALSRVQFSALTSQVHVQDQALSSVYQAIKDFGELLEHILDLEKHDVKRNSQLAINLYKLIKQSNVNNSQNTLKQVKISLYELQNQRFFLSFDATQISEFSISSALQLVPKKMNQFKDNLYKLDWFISQAGLTYLALYISSCYFVISTQLRILHQNQASEQQIYPFSNLIDASLQQRSEYFSDTFEGSKRKLAIHHHLIAIKIASKYVLCETNLLKHILQSFKNNYDIDIQFSEQRQKLQQKLFSFTENMVKNQRKQIVNKISSPKSDAILSEICSQNKQNRLIPCNIHGENINTYTKQEINRNVGKEKKKKHSLNPKSPKISFFTLASPKKQFFDPKSTRKKSRKSSKNSAQNKKLIFPNKNTSPRSQPLKPNNRNISFTSNKTNKSKQNALTHQYFNGQSRITTYCKEQKISSFQTHKKKSKSKTKVKVKEEIRKYYM